MSDDPPNVFRKNVPLTEWIERLSGKPLTPGQKQIIDVLDESFGPLPNTLKLFPVFDRDREGHSRIVRADVGRSYPDVRDIRVTGYAFKAPELISVDDPLDEFSSICTKGTVYLRTEKLLGSVVPGLHNGGLCSPEVGTVRDFCRFERHGIYDRKQDVPLWSPGRFRDDRIHRKSVISVGALVFDYDHLTVNQCMLILDRVRRLQHYAHSTWSHNAGAGQTEDLYERLKIMQKDNCFRLVLGVTRRMTGEDYQKVWKLVDDLLGGFADKACSDPTRIWHVAASPQSNAKYRFELDYEGDKIDVDAALALVDRRDK